MTSMPKADTAVMATSVVSMADEIMQAVRENREHHPENSQSHYLKAAIAAAIAVGAFQMLKKDEHLEEREEHSHHGHAGHRARTVGDRVVIYKDDHPQHSEHKDHKDHHEHSSSGHTRDMITEALGAYALGRQMLGHDDHRILKLVAEGLGAAAFAKEVDRDLVD